MSKIEEAVAFIKQLMGKAWEGGMLGWKGATYKGRMGSAGGGGCAGR